MAWIARIDVPLELELGLFLGEEPSAFFRQSEGDGWLARKRDPNRLILDAESVT